MSRLCLLLFAGFAASMIVVAQPRAQGSPTTTTNRPANEVYEKQLTAQMASVLKMRDDLLRSIDDTSRKLREVAGQSMDKIGIEQLRQPYVEFRNKIQALLDKLDDQGELATALDRARASAQNALGWWQNQPEDEDKRAAVTTLDESVKRFDASEKNRVAARMQAEAELRKMLSRQLQMERIAVTKGIADASRQIESVMNGMQELSKKLSEMAGPQNTPAGLPSS